MTPMAKRQVAWQRLASDLPIVKLDQLISVVPMSAVPELASDIVDGKTQGSWMSACEPD